MKIYVDDPKVKSFKVNKSGKITKSEDAHPTTWENTFIDLNKLKVGEELNVSFNKMENEAIGKRPVYVDLKMRVTKIEE